MAMLPFLPNQLHPGRPRGDLQGPDIPEPDGDRLVFASLGEGRLELVEHERLRDELFDLLAERPHRAPLRERSPPQSLDRLLVQVHTDFCRHAA